MPIPPLAGLCTYEEAARVGVSVDDSVRFLLRLAWIRKRAMEMGLYWLNSTPQWEVKEALSLHLHLDAEHVGMLRRRISEMRNPPPPMDEPPSEPLEAFLKELLWAEQTPERIIGVYGVLRPAILEACWAHDRSLNPLVAHPTRRMLRIMIADDEQTARWGEQAVAVVTGTDESRRRASEWTAHLDAYLTAAGGITGDDDAPAGDLPAARAGAAYQPDYFPQRDDRFVLRGNFVFPPHEVSREDQVDVEEKTLALMCKRALEMDVPELMAPMITEAANQPWAFTTDMCRQLWDEARHAMMGTVYLQHRGIDWKRKVPLHPGASIRLNMHLDPLEAHAVLYAVEQALMPAKTGKRYEWATASEASDALATQFQDYDWADEVLHAQIGKRWLPPMLDMTKEQVLDLGHRKAVETEAHLANYADPDEQINWWPDFVREVLGRETRMDPTKSGIGDPVYHKDQME
ncbi:MAG: hypothetical protein CMJ18_06795 [Phycisphaeraceae bacterium]|nr:hypothetical protein [Phycisphaeraceae bacterium]